MFLPDWMPRSLGLILWIPTVVHTPLCSPAVAGPVPAEADQALLDAMGMIEAQQVDGGSGGGRQADEFAAFKHEVFMPEVAAWMEERHELAGFRIEGRKVASLAAVAQGAGEREIVDTAFSSVLDRDDVIDLMRGEGCLLGCLAVFASVGGAAGHLLAQQGEFL
jgi:hypothetical protein